MKNVKCGREVNFGEYGGAEYFFYDINNDGKLEILSYQGPGVFGAGIFKNNKTISPFIPKTVSVSAFSCDGKRLWTWGLPNPPDDHYISHSYEACIAAADIDDDGIIEIVIADGDRVVILDGRTGHEKNTVKLPYDNFYIVQCAGEKTADNEAAIVIKNGEGGYDGWHYGEPVIGLNSRLEMIWGPLGITGGGHHILALDLNKDGRNEFLIGYCAVSLDGKILWTLDVVDTLKFDSSSQHVDYTDIFMSPDGKLFFSIAGSDKIFLADESGKTFFAKEDIHCQGTAIGQFAENNDFQIALYNSPNGPMVLHDKNGNEIWRKATERRWPLGPGKGWEKNRMHRNRPIVKLSGDDKKQWIAYADGGWPWGMDGKGEISLEFEVPVNSKPFDRPENIPDTLRRDDLGGSFGLKAADLNNDGKDEAIIYNRRFLWIFSI
ncbi:MAG: hypothetical protein A2017_18940 [Lentisphaerae bacterium GWF2_44_16]|nr:MAG: hypothetical protein A2017_18940 [Lentisphaerae bacterium GWF2_44_16]